MKNKLDILMFIASSNFNEEEFLVAKKEFEKANKNVFITSDTSSISVGSNGLRIKADVNLYNINPRNFGAITIIGGAGIINCWENQVLIKKVKGFFDEGKVVSAICAAPVILGKAKLLNGIKATCCPKFSNELIKLGAILVKEDIAVEGNIITGSSASATTLFAQQVISKTNKL